MEIHGDSLMMTITTHLGNQVEELGKILEEITIIIKIEILALIDPGVIGIIMEMVVTSEVEDSEGEEEDVVISEEEEMETLIIKEDHLTIGIIITRIKKILGILGIILLIHLLMMVTLVVDGDYLIAMTIKIIK